MEPLILGSALAVLALVYVLWPLFREVAPVVAVGRPVAVDEASAVDALREIEFDRATGKLSDEDYATLRATYAPRALAELKAREAGAVAVTGEAPAEDAAERLIARAKDRTGSCATCGPRPESDALFCSDCGRYLAAACLRCGASVDAPHARFCTDCGQTLAA
ncbi:MAG: hypothetical protein RL139_452 [Gemmatimonadota bacterium]|jgi:Double zinc ribbon